jgi:hypothetical protein
MHTQTKRTKVKKPQPGRERLIEENGKHYWLQSDGSKRETDWILRDGLAVLTSDTVNLLKSQSNL